MSNSRTSFNISAYGLPLPNKTVVPRTKPFTPIGAKVLILSEPQAPSQYTSKFISCLIAEFFRVVVTQPVFPFFKFYEAFTSFFVSFSCLGFNHSSPEKLQSLVSFAHLSGCFFFASSYTSLRLFRISLSFPVCLCSGVT